MAEIFVFENPEKLAPVANDLIVIGDSEDLKVDGKPKRKIAKLGNIESLSVQSLTYAALNTLLTASELVVGAKYLITDATTANIPLIVEAVAVNEIHTDAKSPDFPQDVIQYDFTTGTRGTIKWRWDTLQDVSMAQDLRNPTNITYGTGINSVHIGPNSTGTLGNNVTNVIIGQNSIFDLKTGSSEVNIGDNATLTNTLLVTNVTVDANQVVTADGALTNMKFKFGVDLINSPAKSTVYNNQNGEVWGDDNPQPVFIYVQSGAFAIVSL